MNTSNTPSEVSPPESNSLYRRMTWQRVQEYCIQYFLMACALLSVLTTVAIVAILLTETIVGPADVYHFFYPEKSPVELTEGSEHEKTGPFFQEVSLKDFVTDPKWSPRTDHYGVLPLAIGTLQITVIAAVLGLPLGLLIAIYLSEYATPRTRGIVKPVLEILAGVPTIVYGYFALTFVTPNILRPVFQDMLGFDVNIFNALSGGLVVGIMIIPMVSSLSEDALRSVPRSLREAGYALGSTKYDVCLRVIVPAAFSGIIASFLLAMSRAIGETMIVTIASGIQPRLSFNPLNQVQTMTSFIVEMQKTDHPLDSVQFKSLYAVGLCLFLSTLAMNIVSYIVMRRFREVYS